MRKRSCSSYRKNVYKIPSALEAKLREIVKDDNEFDVIKCEIQRSFEKQLGNRFIELYEELEDEIKQKEEGDDKKHS